MKEASVQKLNKMLSDYRVLNNKVQNFVGSNRLESNVQAMEATIEASNLHTKIMDLVCKEFSVENIKAEYKEHNRSVIAKLLALVVQTDMRFSIGHSFFGWRFTTYDFYIMQNNVKCNLTTDYYCDTCDAILTLKVDALKEQIDYVENSWDYSSGTNITNYTLNAPKDAAENHASDSLKEFSKKLGKTIEYIFEGSTHQQWLYVGFYF